MLAAEAECEREFLAFPKRREDRVTGKKVGGYDLSISHKKASDADGDWLGTNVVGDTQNEFMKKSKCDDYSYHIHYYIFTSFLKYRLFC